MSEDRPSKGTLSRRSFINLLTRMPLVPLVPEKAVPSQGITFPAISGEVVRIISEKSRENEGVAGQRMLLLKKRDEETWEKVAETVTNADGIFFFDRLEPGETYHVTREGEDDSQPNELHDRNIEDRTTLAPPLYFTLPLPPPPHHPPAPDQDLQNL